MNHKQLIKFLNHKYYNMSSRVRGTATKDPHMFVGLSLLPRQEFVSWSLSNPNFIKLYSVWVSKGKDIRFTPTPHRLTTSKGYETWNMLWMTNSESCSINSYRRAG